MSWTITFPILIPFATAVLAFIMRNSTSSRWVSVAGSLITLCAAIGLMLTVLDQGVVAAQMGEWAAPFGITMVADKLSAMMVLLVGIIGLAVTVYAVAEVPRNLEKMGFHSLLQFLLAGVTGSFLTGDIFNLYVWFEVMLISSFGLLIMGGSREQIDGAVKYVTLNLVSTTMLLAGIGLLYGLTGTLNMADLHATVANLPEEKHGAMGVVTILFLFAFGVKSAVFPLFFWLPAAYHTPTSTVSAVFAALLTKVGVYALFRCFTLIFTLDSDFVQDILLWTACLTMLSGVLGALAQNNVRRVLSFQIISSIGFLILGLALQSPLAMAGALFYLMHNVIVKANLFLLAGVGERLTGSSDFDRSGGLYKSAPFLAFLFFIPMFALAGFPPLSGFWGKLLLVQASLDLHMWLIAGITLFAGLLTIFSLGRIWIETYWRPHPDDLNPSLSDLGKDVWPLLLPISGLVAITVTLGVFPQPFIQFAQDAAAQLLDPQAYISTVLGVQP